VYPIGMCVVEAGPRSKLEDWEEHRNRDRKN
jgi:hypothetical protein